MDPDDHEPSDSLDDGLTRDRTRDICLRKKDKHLTDNLSSTENDSGSPSETEDSGSHSDSSSTGSSTSRTSSNHSKSSCSSKKSERSDNSNHTSPVVTQQRFVYIRFLVISHLFSTLFLVVPFVLSTESKMTRTRSTTLSRRSSSRLRSDVDNRILLNLKM